MKALKLIEFTKLIQLSLDENDPLIFEDTAMYVVNHYGDSYEEDANTGDMTLVTANKQKEAMLKGLQS